MMNCKSSNDVEGLLTQLTLGIFVNSDYQYNNFKLKVSPVEFDPKYCDFSRWTWKSDWLGRAFNISNGECPRDSDESDESD